MYRLEFKLAMHPKLTETIVQDFSRGDTVGECVLCPYIAYLSVYALILLTYMYMHYTIYINLQSKYTLHV